MRTMRRSPKGFTLIEVLVAFAVAALGLAALMQIFGTGLQSARISEGYARATLLAESKLASVGIEEPLVAGESGGDFGDGFRWRLIVQPLDDGETTALVASFRVRVTVSWGTEGRAPRSVTLDSLRLAARR